MLIWLLNHFEPLRRQFEILSSGDSHVALTARIALASVMSFLLALLLGPIVISWLKSRFQEKIVSAYERLNELQAKKQSTPTMGGLFVSASIVLASLICGDLSSPYTLCGIGVVTAFCSLGAWDDWIKLSTHRNGLTVKQKFAVQLLLGLFFATAMYFTLRDRPDGLSVVFTIGGA